jgi:glycolate oxidase FAD binding subunit
LLSLSSIGSDVDADLTETLVQSVRRAAAQQRALYVVGGNSKRFYGRAIEGEPLEVAGHRGILSYDPTELVVTLRAGTPLAQLEARLGEHGQMLCFEPLRFPASTIGGVVAAGLAGPRRPYAGGIRDSILGVKVLDGRGDIQRFGGVVFKNVAGFDAFRLMAGSLGCLGVLLEVSLRVVPAPRIERALAFEMTCEAARERLVQWSRLPLPISGACFDGERLHVRLSGGEGGVRQTALRLGGEEAPLGFWDELRDHRHAFFERASVLWRLTVPVGTPALSLEGRWLWDWGGAQRWLVSDEPHDRIRNVAARAGGHATLFRGAQPGEEVFTPLPSPLLALHRRLKSAFDPERILNPGRMYSEL